MEDFLILDNIDEALKVNVGLKLKRLVTEVINMKNKFDRKAFINGPFALDIVQATLEHLRYVHFMFFRKRIQ